MRTSISDYNSYKEICTKASTDDSTFTSFKTHPDFTPILEHVNKEQGQGYIEYIKNSTQYSKELIDVVKINDRLGGTKVEQYEEPFTNISPSTLRYFKVALELQEMFGDLSGKKIVEIGGGYGGQSLILHSLFSDIDYTIVDLPEVTNLAKTYLVKNGIDTATFYSVDDIIEPLEVDLVISNYAISECTKVVQKIYTDNILKQSKNGYITYNNISHLFNVNSYTPTEFKGLLNCQEKVEIPQTGANIIYYW